MGIINRVPKGLLGLLDAKTQGETPRDTIGELAPVIDLTPNYLADLPFEITRSSFALTAALVDVAQVVVPAGELWYVYGASFQISASANTTVEGALTFNFANAGSAIDYLVLTPHAVRTNQTYNAGEGPSGGVQFQPPLLCSPGNTFASRLIDAAAASVTLTTNVLYRSVQV